eukprot:GILI01045115.1.p2 GENE.GILI01045115.1~~GILI01045115.1.p2  ORF type:complete len:109 (-),score=3.55 GILI01045115.1:197-523(-)
MMFISSRVHPSPALAVIVDSTEMLNVLSANAVIGVCNACYSTNIGGRGQLPAQHHFGPALNYHFRATLSRQTSAYIAVATWLWQYFRLPAICAKVTLGLCAGFSVSIV